MPSKTNYTLINLNENILEKLLRKNRPELLISCFLTLADLTSSVGAVSKTQNN